MVLFKDWEKLDAKMQSKLSRDILLKELMIILEKDNVKVKYNCHILKNIYFPYIQIKLRMIKTSLICIKYLIISNEGKEGLCYLDKLVITLKEAYKLSKDPKNEIFFSDESLSSNFLEYLSLFSEKITKKEENENILEIINLLIGNLKNNASNQVVRAKFFEKKNLGIFSYFFHFFEFEDKNIIENESKTQEIDKRYIYIFIKIKLLSRTQKIFEIYTNLTGLFRNLAIDSECIGKFLEINVVLIL